LAISCISADSGEKSEMMDATIDGKRAQTWDVIHSSISGPELPWNGNGEVRQDATPSASGSFLEIQPGQARMASRSATAFEL
jgi:hypothetical protein